MIRTLVMCCLVPCLLFSAQLSPTEHRRSIVGKSDLTHIEEVIGTPFYEISRTVGRMEVGAGYCSSVRIGKTLFLTNHHCFEFKPCNQLSFRLGYEKDLSKSKQAVFICESVLAKSEIFDFALYRVKENPSDPSYPVATVFGGKLEKDHQAFLPSHVATFYKQIDKSENCRIVDPNPKTLYGRQTITHACDTMGGSSGAPVFSKKTGAVIALHWGGKGDYPYNHAILISDVLGILKKEIPAVLSEINVTY